MAPAAAPPPITTRRPTGLPSWPIGLLAGVEKSGKSLKLAEASASDLIHRTFWIGCGEDDPDEYGALPGADFEIVQHDGTYRGILNAVESASAQPAGEDGRPNLIVFDSGARYWHLLTAMAQAEQDSRQAKRAAQGNANIPLEGVKPTPDLWNTANDRHEHLMDIFRKHEGPVLITSRLELQMVVDAEGKPTKDKAWSVISNKRLPYDVGFIVQMRGSYPEVENYLTGVRSLRYKHETIKTGKEKGKAKLTPLDHDFTIESIWRKLGVHEKVTARTHSNPVTYTDSEANGQRTALLEEIKAHAERAHATLLEIADDWAQGHNGQKIGETTDFGGLELLRDDLRARAQVVAGLGDPGPTGHTDEEAPAQDEQDARATAQEPPEPERAPDPAQAQAQRAPVAETRAQRQMALAMAELTFQADVLAANLAEYAKPVLATAGDVNSLVPAKTVRFLIEQRQQIIPALRDQGRATEADAYERLGQAYPILMEHVTEAEGFTRESVAEAAPAQ